VKEEGFVMKTDARDEELMTRYLLGELSETEQLLVEERFFTDEEFSERLLALENELKYDYARGALSPQARARFERRFLATDEDRKEVEFAGAVMGMIAEVAEPEGP
jgi:anti-sigma factor RsiW